MSSPDIELDPNADYELNKCSGLVGEHASFCEGDCETVIMTGLEIEVGKEYAAWNKAGMQTNSIAVDAFEVSVKLDILINSLIQAGVLDEAEMNFKYRSEKLKRMKDIRAEIEPQLRQARIANLGNGAPPLLGPNGERLH